MTIGWRTVTRALSCLLIVITAAGCWSEPPPAINQILIATRPTPEMPPTPIGQSGAWHLIFSDEFNAPAFDPARWTTCYWWNKRGCTIVTNQEMEWYQPGQVQVVDGMLQLRADHGLVVASNGHTYRYLSGMISSGRATSDTSHPARFAFTYGFAEMRAKIPAGQGLWPAFWLLPADHNSRPEIDVMEITGDAPHTVHLRFHYLTASGEREDIGGEWTGPDFSADWHTFAIAWTQEALIWYVDGVERWRFTDRAAIPAEPMYLLANLAVGGDWPGAPDAATKFPADYQIDYIRVWQAGADAPQPTN